MMAALGYACVALVARGLIAFSPLLAAANGASDANDAGSVQALGKAFSVIRKSVRTEDRYSPVVLLVVAGAAIMSASVYGVWRWQQKRGREPSSRALLRLACDQLKLSTSQRRLVWLLGTVAALEPASALASPQLLTGLVDQAEQAGLHLSPARTLQVGQILDIVSAASTAAE
jgi:hypothetical protein